MRTSATMVLAVLFAICFTAAAFGQTNFTITLTATDGSSSGQVTLGVNTAATDCIDPGFSEQELPPIPPAGIFDVRLTPGLTHSCLGQGTLTDIRHLVTNIQADTFTIKFQPSTEAVRPTMLLTWPSNIDSMGGGRWVIRNDNVGSVFSVDMTTVDSLAVDPDLGKVVIIKSDSASFRTFTMAKIVTDLDDKGKPGKAVKPTPYKVDFSFHVNSGSATTLNGLHVEFPIAILAPGLTITPTPSGVGVDAKSMKYDIHWLTPLAPSTIVTISGTGNKGKAQTAKYWWLTGSTITGAKLKTTPADFTSNILRVHMPNAFNAGTEMMTALYPKGTFLRVGTTIPGANGYVHSVIHQTYSDVVKSLYSKKLGYQAGTASCLDYFDKAGVRNNPKGPFKKEVKTLSPDKQNNALFGEALVLKVNLGLSQTSNTPAGLGALILRDTSVFNGSTLSQLSLEMDTLLSCRPIANPAHAGVTFAECVNVVRKVNEAFYSATVDTFAFGNGSKLGDVRFKGAVYISDLNWLERVAGTAPEPIPSQRPSAGAALPGVFALDQNYPNPFNPVTTIRFTLPAAGLVSLTVYDILGREVSTLADHRQFGEGMNELPFDGGSVASGVYFYRITVFDAASGAVTNQDVKRMMLLK